MRLIAILGLAAVFAAGPAFAQGGEGNNTDCNGEGNPNSPCAVVGTDGGQAQAQSQTVTQELDVDAEAYAYQTQGNTQTTTFNDATNPASSAPSLALANCTSGASGQGFGGGGSIGGPDSVCQLLNMAIVAQDAGDFEAAAELRARALETYNRRHFVSQLIDWIPLVGKLF